MIREVRTLKNLCIVLPKMPAISETFLRAHVDHLSPDRRLLLRHEGRLTREDGSLLAPGGVRGLPRRVRNKVNRVFVGKAPRDIAADFFKANHVDVVLAEYGQTGSATAASCRLAGVPLVVHFHGYDASNRIELERHADGYQRMFKSANAIVVVSKAMQRQLLSLGAPEEKVRLNCYGTKIDERPASDPASNPPTLVGVGRFVEKKAPHLTILAFAKAAADRPDARLILAGDGPLWGACVSLVKALSLEHAVELPGLIDHERVSVLMQQARAFVQHSVVASNGDSEGTPLAVLEAAAAGIPVISTRHAGIPDVIESGVTGFLVDEFDIDGMATFMRQVLDDPNQAASVGREARAYISANLSLPQSLERLRTILNEAAAEGVTSS